MKYVGCSSERIVTFTIHLTHGEAHALRERCSAPKYLSHMEANIARALNVISATCFLADGDPKIKLTVTDLTGFSLTARDTQRTGEAYAEKLANFLAIQPNE